MTRAVVYLYLLSISCMDLCRRKVQIRLEVVRMDRILPKRYLEMSVALSGTQWRRASMPLKKEREMVRTLDNPPRYLRDDNRKALGPDSVRRRWEP